MKRTLLINLLFLFCLCAFPQEEIEEEIEHSPQNSKCFTCHGSTTYSYYNDVVERSVTKRMNPYFIIDSITFYDQNHKSFECIDCHSYDYRKFPHDGELRMEEFPACIDCHGGDEDYAQYHFEEIELEYKESVHATKHDGDFTCWSCHDPHTYKLNARNNNNIKETIVYDNNICLSCHADINKYQLISSNVNPSVIDSHDWLPNQIAHFAHVRCIECHTHTSDSVMVAHQIQTKDKAVKKCVECHSKNSMLMSSLYKFKAEENRKEYGFLNSAALGDTYIIGANRNTYLNNLSLIIFGAVLLLILIHVIFRIKSK